MIRPAIRAMQGYVPGEQPRGGEFIKLNTNENPYPPSPRVLDAIRAALTGDRLRKYPDPLGTDFRPDHGTELAFLPRAQLGGVNVVGAQAFAVEMDSIEVGEDAEP